MVQCPKFCLGVPVSKKTQSDGAKLLEEMLAKRGYLLSYHRMLAASDAQLLANYDALYTRLTLDQRVLTPVERETVWIALIATTREKYAVFHFDRATAAGMDDDAISDAVAVAAACESFDAMQRAQVAFVKWVPESRAMKRYLRMFDVARGSIPPATAEISAVVCHAAHRNADGMRVHLARAFEHGASREQLAEGLSYVLLHRGGPTMIDAVNCWEASAAALNIPGPY
jgi:4-carboxymuconolactone decarboxylase